MVSGRFLPGVGAEPLIVAVTTALASLGLFFSFMLWKTERGPGSHGLETIAIKSAEGA